MKFRQIGTRVLSLALSGVMLISAGATVLPASAVSRAYTPIQLEAAPTKIMDYFNTQTPDGVTWVADYGALAFLPAAAIGDVTCAVEATDGAVWVGTKNGLMRIDFSENDSRDMVQYFSGNRYLYGGDDHVTGLAADDDCGVWVRNALGSVHIKMPRMTMEDRTYFYEKMAADVNDRRGMISSSNTYSYDPATGEYTQTAVHTSDNDGLWTAMYAMGEILRYQTLKEENAAPAEIAAAKAAATRATKAVLLLDYISGRGNGFPCRSYMLASEALAQPDTAGVQAQNGFWFEIKMLDGAQYPDPIIGELKQDADPIGIAQVRITKDAMSKKGSQIFPNDTDYNGLGLSQSSIDIFNASRASGEKLGTDIICTDGDQVYPLMVQGVNIGTKYIAPTAANPIVPNDPRIKFRLTAPVYEEIPTIFNDLFPDSAIKNGKIDMEQIVYKADTSSDEVDGHYALFLTAYRYLCDEPGDGELKDIIAEATLRMTDLILEDDRYYIVDATGKSTQWSRWLSRYFNDSLDVMKSQALWLTDSIGVNEEGDDMLSYGYEDGPLNALEVMSALKIASYIADQEGETGKAATYHLAYDQCFESPYSGGGIPNDPGSYENGKGYMDMALEYVERRIVRQATDAYDENDSQPVQGYVEREPDFDNRIFNNALHADWTQYVNYSDEELGWFPVYALVTLEEDGDRLAKIVEAYDQWYDGQEEREENPFYTFLYQLAHPEKTDVDLQSAVRYFYRSPLLRNGSISVRGDRQDVFYIEAGNRDKRAQTNYALPLDERTIEKNNNNPFTGWTVVGESRSAPYLTGSLGDCTVFTLSYWLGRYYGMITEAGSDYYARKTPDVTISTGSGSISVTVKDGTAPLVRMIVDFYEDGAYIGRERTDGSGVATLTHTASGTVSAVVGERLVGDTVYYRAEVQDTAPLLSLAIMSDIHIGCTDHVMPTTFEERFETALEYYTDNGLNYDAIVLNGDCVDNPSVDAGQYDRFMSVLNDNIQADAFPVINTGNHEIKLGSTIPEVFYEKTGIGEDDRYTISPNDAAKEAKMIFYDTWFSGYHFIVFNNDRKDLTDERIAWLEEKIGEGYQGAPADPAQPVFLINHYDAGTWNSKTPNTVNKLRPIFEAHPNVVMFTGHSHVSLNNIHNLFSDGVGCLSIHDGGMADVKTEEDYFTEKDVQQGLFVEVFKDHMLIHQLAFYDGGYEMADPVSVSLDDMLSALVTDNVPPAFPHGASVEVSDVTFNSCDIAFPAATDNTTVSHYNIFVRTGSGETRQVDLVHNPFWRRAEPAEFTRTLKGLEPGSTGNTVLVEAFDAYGNLSARIESETFDVAEADPAFEADAPHILRMDFDAVEGGTVKDASVNQNDALLEGGAAVVHSDVFGKKVLSLDGVGQRGDINSSCARIPFNSSLYTANAITIETAFMIDSALPTDNSALHGSKEQHILSTYEFGGYSLAYKNTDGKLYFYMDDGFPDLSAAITLDVPHHVMVTYDHAMLKLFVDGVLCDQKTAADDIFINTRNDLFLGADSEGFRDRYQFFKGEISYVNIFDVGLTAEKVADCYLAFQASLPTAP